MSHPQPDFLRRVLIVAGIALLGLLVVALLWQTAQALLILFAGVLMAVFLHALSDFARKWLPLSAGWALALVCVLLVVALGLGSWLMAERISTQLGQLRQALPASVEQLKQRLKQTEMGRTILNQTQNGSDLIPSEINPWSRASRLLSSTIGFMVGVIIILFIGLYLAVEPHTYRQGILYLAPPGQRARIEQVLDQLGHMLRWWLIGQAVSMGCVALLVTLGLWLLNVPLALTLGLIAGLLEFIPRVGPVVAAVPAILVSLMQTPSQTLYVILLYIGVQSVESYLILPLVQRKAVDLPPALTLTALFLMGILFGFVGLLLATPLTVVVVSLVKQLYVKNQAADRLGETAAGGLNQTTQHWNRTGSTGSVSDLNFP
jgi:predicted PurR-regulated permease PerM